MGSDSSTVGLRGDDDKVVRGEGTFLFFFARTSLTVSAAKLYLVESALLEFFSQSELSFSLFSSVGSIVLTFL